MAPMVQTVLGEIAPTALGRTLTHEHLQMNFSHFYRQPPAHLANFFNDKKFALKTSCYLRQYPYSSKYNLMMTDNAAKIAVINDVHAYKKFGGGAIVENTTEGLQRDVAFYQYVSKECGIHIVAGTGHYLADLQKTDTQTSSVEDIFCHMMTEIVDGCLDNTSVRAGFMGELASVWPLKDFEKRVIQAAGELQARLGCGVSFHPHRDPKAPFEIMRLYLEAGGKADKAVMSHLDRTLLQNDKLLEFAALGGICQFDLFGTEVSYYQLNDAIDMPSDSQRIDKIRLLVDEGMADRVMMSHDIHTKHRLIDFGGHGYSHILNNVIPRMRTKKFSQQTIDQITIKNPAKWLEMEKYVSPGGPRILLR